MFFLEYFNGSYSQKNFMAHPIKALSYYHGFSILLLAFTSIENMLGKVLVALPTVTYSVPLGSLLYDPVSY